MFCCGSRILINSVQFYIESSFNFCLKFLCLIVFMFNFTLLLMIVNSEKLYLQNQLQIYQTMKYLLGICSTKMFYH